MSILSFALACMRALSAFLNFIERKQLMQAGADAEKLHSIQEIAEDENRLRDALLDLERRIAGDPAKLRGDDQDSYFRD